MLDEQTAKIIDRVSSYTGIQVPAVLADYVSTYIAKHASLASLSLEEYCELLIPGTPHFDNLIVEVTINETYFFREEQQFEFLKNFFFPKFYGKKMVIWSGACSSGEEPVSLCALATSCGVYPVVYASDIDQGRLKYFKNEIYSRASFRKEGKKYWSILESTKCGDFTEKSFILSKHIFDKINIHFYNLNGDLPCPVPPSVNLIFLRNVFIYFNKESRKKILTKLSKVLAPNGLIFLASSEIGSITEDLLPEDIHKVNYESIYFLSKKSNPDFVVDTHLLQEKIKLEKTEPVKKIPKLSSYPKILTKKQNKKNNELNIVSKNLIENKLDFFSKKDDKSFSENTEIIFKKIKSLLGEKKPEDARDVIRNNYPENENSLYKDFFSAYIEGKVGNFYVAEKYFMQIAKDHPDFWPAIFFYAVLLKEFSRDEEAKVLFTRCATLIDTYEKSGSSHLDFIADNLSVAYLYIMCLKFSN